MMTRLGARSLLLFSTATLLAASFAAPPLAAQGLDGQIGRFYDDGTWDFYRIGVNRRLTGPLGLGLHGNYFQRAGGAAGRLAGLSADLTAFRGGMRLWTLESVHTHSAGAADAPVNAPPREWCVL